MNGSLRGRKWEGGRPAGAEKTWRAQSVCAGAACRAPRVSGVEEEGWSRHGWGGGPGGRELYSRAVGLRPHHERGREVREEDFLKTMILERWLWQQCGEWLEKDKTGANETSLAIRLLCSRPEMRDWCWRIGIRSREEDAYLRDARLASLQWV